MAATEAPIASAAMASPESSLLRRVVSVDTAVSLRIHSLCSPVPRALLKALEISGDGRLWFPLAASLLPLSPSSAKAVAVGLLAGSFLDLLLVGLAKHLVRRPRPVYNRGMSLAFSVDHWSFPSGHSSRVFFIAAYLYLYAAALRPILDAPGGISDQWIREYYKGEIFEILMVLVFIWAAATSASRVLLGRHFVLDVISGACLGVFEALFVFHFLKL